MASRILKVWYFILDHWQLPVIIIAILIGWLLFRSWRKSDTKGLVQAVQDELGIIQAGSATREMQLQLGTEQTLGHIKDKYAAKTMALDAVQQLKVKELENDPVALAKYLERITRG